MADLVTRREAVMDAADRALDAAWPARQGDDFVRAMQAAAAELEQIAGEMMVSGVPAVEQSRAHRYRGSILSDLEPALGKEMLEKARVAYSMSEALLQGHDDPLETAKLNFNFGNMRTRREGEVKRIIESIFSQTRFFPFRVIVRHISGKSDFTNGHLLVRPGDRKHPMGMFYVFDRGFHQMGRNSF